MELKRILARDSRTANEKALQLYGPDVLVISSQRVDSQTELIVAIDTPQDQAPAAPETATATAQSDRFVAFSDVFKVSVEQPQGQPENDDALDEPLVYEPAATRLAALKPATTNTPSTATAASAPLAAPAQPSQAGDTAFAQAEADDLRRSRDTVELLRLEIAALRQEFNLNRQVAMWQSGQGLSPELTAWFAHMQELGVPASLRTLMADSVKDCETVGAAWPLVHQSLVSAVQRRKAAWPTKGVHALVGPSGAGKTLMIARMAMAAAASMPVEDMAIISFADTKAGAWSQLQVLAAQTGVGCYRAADASTLKLLLEELAHHKVIWIDSSGIDFLAQAAAIQSASGNVQLHAVLALDATVTNVRKTFDACAPTWKSIMLSKFDEAAHPWHVLKALCEHNVPVSAVGASHQLRVEPAEFDATALVDLALQGLQPSGMVPDVAVLAPVKKTRRRTTVAKAKAVHG